MTRFNPNGSLDRSFGEGGISPRIPAERQSSLAVGPDGEVVVASELSQGAIGLTRLTSAGELDSAFGQGGTFVADVGGYGDGPLVVVQPDRKIVLVAQRYDNYPMTSDGALVVNRYTERGALDVVGFGIGGTAEFGDSSARPGDATLLSNGGIAVGTPCCYYDGHTPDAFFLGRLTSSGAPASVGLQGVKVAAKWATVSSVIALKGGKIEVLGTDFNGFFAARLLSDGSLDRAFGDAGVSRIDQIRHDRLRGFLLSGAVADSRGRVVGAVGVQHAREGEYGSHLALFRILANGSPDRVFAGGGEARFTLGGTSYPVGVGMQSSGRIVALVERGDCERTCTIVSNGLVRYLGGSSRARCMGRKATVVGTRRKETLTGTPRRDVIAALGGNDVVQGRGGNDLICGGRGNDRLLGGSGKDRLAGGPGRDQVRR